MDLLKRMLAIFVLMLFVAYSGGIGFSVHNCEHCRQKKVYLFQHPDCCSTATEEHHHQADDCENCSPHDAACCNHAEKNAAECEKNTPTMHCQPCCFSEYQFFKINENYFAPEQESWIVITDFNLFTEILSFHWEQQFVEKIHFSQSNPHPPPLLPGGERFIVFTHQLLFYA